MRFLSRGKVQGNASETRCGCHGLPRKVRARSRGFPTPTDFQEGGGGRKREGGRDGAGTREAGGGFEVAPEKVLNACGLQVDPGSAVQLSV